MKKLTVLMMSLLTALAFADAPQILNMSAKQRYPWNGKVDISFEIAGELPEGGASAWNAPVFSLTATNRADGTCHVASADAVSGDTDATAGTHHVVWDLDAQGLAFKSDEVVFSVTYTVPHPRYCVIDLSAGADAESYPVSMMNEPPSGGFNTDDYKMTNLVLRLIDPGTFKMGGSYDVTLTKPYYMGVFEVTQKQYELVTGEDTSYYKGEMCPVEFVSWNMVRGSNNWPTVRTVESDSFVGRLQSRTGLAFDLPTEAQWEYACRAGTTSDYNNGSNTVNSLKLLGRYAENRLDGRGGYTNHTTVGSYTPNGWGLYDMHGNVRECCLDWFVNSLSNGMTDPEGPTSGSTTRSARGGGFDSISSVCTSSARRSCSPSLKFANQGFRLAIHLDTEEPGAGVGQSGVLCTAETAAVAIDSIGGVRDSDGQEMLSYSSWWDGDAAATVTIAEDGAALAEGLSGAGEFQWNATRSGTRVLTHTTYTNGVEAKVETAAFNVPARDIADAQVDVDCSEVTYRGTAYEPEIRSVTLDGRALAAGTDYTLAYSNNVNVGTATITLTGINLYCGTYATNFTIVAPSVEMKLGQVLAGLPATVAPDGAGGWIVTLTDDIDSADLPIEFLDDLGSVTLDLNGHDLVGGDGQPAIRVVPDEAGDGEPTQLTVVTTGGDATVQGGAGAPAIEVAEDVRDGVVINIGEGVTVRGGGSDVPAIVGTVGTNDGTIVLPEVRAEVTLTAGTYFKMTLVQLGYDVPTNGTPYSVVAKGLPAGLTLKYNAAVTKKDKKGKKVVVKKAKVEWWIEGVPTAALDYVTNPPYLVITANGRTETYALPLEVLAQEVTELADLAFGQSLNEQFYLPGVTNGWAVSGLPAGLKYTAKLLTTKKKSGKKTIVTTNALPYSVYGKTTKAGLFTVTAKKKKGGYYETMKYRVLVTPKAPEAKYFGDNLTNVTTMAYVPFVWDLTADIPATGGKVAKVAGLPAGVAFVGQMIAGKPTKAGTFVVTFTKNVTTGTGKNKKTIAKTAQILWKVVPNDAEVSLDFNKAGGVVEGGVVGLKYGDLLAFTATEGAKVTASGLPAGIALANLGGGAYAFTGFTTKAGTYLVTVTVTLNGKSVRQRVALKVEGLPAWAKGTFNGAVMGGSPSSATDPDAQERVPLRGLATITVSSVGKISGKFYEGGTNWTLSAASYTAATSAAAPAYTCSNVVATYTYKVNKTVKGKKQTVTLKVTRTFTLTVDERTVTDNEPVPTVPEVPTRGFATLTEVGVAGAPLTTSIEAYQNIWGRAAYKALGNRLFTSKSGKKTLAYNMFTVEAYTNDVGAVTFIRKGADVDKTGLALFLTLSLKVAKTGAVTATLPFDTGMTKKDAKTKKTVKVIYKPACSTVVVPTAPADADPFAGNFYLFYAPSSANRFPGFAACVPYAW